MNTKEFKDKAKKEGLVYFEILIDGRKSVENFGMTHTVGICTKEQAEKLRQVAKQIFAESE